LIRFGGAKVGQLVLVDKVRNVFSWWCRRQCCRLLRERVRRRVVRLRPRCCRVRRRRRVHAFVRRRLVRRGRFCPRVERFKLFRELFRLVGCHLGRVRRVLLALLQAAGRSGGRFPAFAECFRNVGRLPFRILDSLAVLRCVLKLFSAEGGRQEGRNGWDVPRWRLRRRWKAARGSWRRPGTFGQSSWVSNKSQLTAPALNLSFPALETHRVAFPFRSSLSACENSFKPKFSMYAPAAISSVNASSVACSDLVCRGDRELVSDVVPPHPTTRGTCVDVSTHLF
jgi:hypothetical protein